MTTDAAADSAGPAAASRTVAPSAQPVGELLADLYRMHAVGLVRIAVLLVGDQATAEDVVQDVFARLQRGGARLREPDKAVPYLRTSVLNGCRSVLRTRRRARLLRVPHEPPVWSAEAAMLASEDRRAVLAAVARLTGRQREVLVLRYYLGLADQEIAAALRVSRGTVSSTASRALAALARELREES
ncbi:MAG TPA: sigma-70 family RNA polymerase sigma factor [Streptosporangiaceae bacterium]|nr:sigma-70 family RNA polymerase sigma factor [Streptosporangiaceae bacterium]